MSEKNWIKNVIEYQDSGKPGKCPFCGGSDIDVKELSIGRGSITFICQTCKSFRHFDCIKKVGGGVSAEST